MGIPMQKVDRLLVRILLAGRHGSAVSSAAFWQYSFVIVASDGYFLERFFPRRGLLVRRGAGPGDRGRGLLVASRRRPGEARRVHVLVPVRSRGRKAPARERGGVACSSLFSSQRFGRCV